MGCAPHYHRQKQLYLISFYLSIYLSIYLSLSPLSPSPGCDQYAKPTCWLKSTYAATSANACRVSGWQAGYPLATGAAIAAAVSYSLLVGPAVVSRFVVLA